MLSNNGGDDPLSLMKAEERHELLCQLLGDEHADSALTVRALSLWLADRWLTAGKQKVIVTPDEDIFLYGSNLAHWVNAGGFKRWFENGQGDLLLQALHALEVLGADDEALLLREAASAVPEDERNGLEVAYDLGWDTSQILTPAQEASLAELDNAFRALWEANTLNDRLAAFARQRCLGPKPGSKPMLKPTRKRGPRGESKGYFTR